MTNIHFSDTVITGGGPAGLFCALRLTEAGIPVTLYDRMETPGRKFILAGLTGGLNITNSASPAAFAEKYYENSSFFSSLLKDFSPEDTADWYRQLGSGSFRGNGGKIYASETAEKILENWLERLNRTGLFRFCGNREFVSVEKAGNRILLTFRAAGPEGAGELIRTECSHAVFAMGGGSRSKTGSDGSWTKAFEAAGIKVNPLKPANCAVLVNWSDRFRERIKESSRSEEVIFSADGIRSTGEAVFTEYGIEGSGIYSLVHGIRGRLEKGESCTVNADLLPGLTEEKIREKLSRQKGKSSLSNYLRKSLKLSGTRFLLLKELATAEELSSIESNPALFKNLKIRITGLGSLEEAISSAGGVSFEDLDENLMLRKFPGIYVIGEMADWEAPTGGYMLQGCFSMAYRAAGAIIGHT